MTSSSEDAAPRPLLIVMDETPRALQTLRFAVDNLIHSRGEQLALVFCLPPTTSTLLKNKVTSRIRSFVALCTEKYMQKPNLKLFILDRPDIMVAIQDLCAQLSPRMLVLGNAEVSFLPKGDVDNKLHSGTGAHGTAYYTSEFKSKSGRGSPDSTAEGAHLSERHSRSSIKSGSGGGGGERLLEEGGAASASATAGSHPHEGGVLGVVEDLWHALTDAVHHTRKLSEDAQAVPGGKSAYVVEGEFAESVRRAAVVPVVVVQVTVEVSQ